MELWLPNYYVVNLLRESRLADADRNARRAFVLEGMQSARLMGAWIESKGRALASRLLWLAGQGLIVVGQRLQHARPSPAEL